MGYVHALEMLPQELIEKIQEYVDGQVIYIPKVNSKKCKWGEKTDTKAYFKERNFKIYNSYKNGTTVIELSEKYFLTPKSIQRIIRSIQIL
ncbi:CD3324 family protein [Anaerocolumna sp. MB42-C2]|uniref:CD3324 family protein n=1 Tax=Anaerocolumna sp. MB42-C2 TaxID=3070997 RepID=UPI0027E00A6C|nr:CD3324 family protein [Anaerocolumna sp. MB42-C2]WMJ89189.1 CD3324 family protein [Anaerocolumna sp. MB42-C2]